MKNFEKILFYSIPALFGATVIFLQIFGVPELWKMLVLYVLPLFIGSYLLEQGKAFGCLPGVFLGIHITAGGILEMPRRMNMGNAGPRIEPTWENSQWYIWHTEIIWGIVFSLFFAALGIYVFIKNKTDKKATFPKIMRLYR